MAINTSPKEMPTVGGNPTAGTINASDFPTVKRSGKAFETPRPAVAMYCRALHWSDASDGPVRYSAKHRGLVHYLPTLHDAAQFLVRIGGRL